MCHSSFISHLLSDVSERMDPPRCDDKLCVLEESLVKSVGKLIKALHQRYLLECCFNDDDSAKYTAAANLMGGLIWPKEPLFHSLVNLDDKLSNSLNDTFHKMRSMYYKQIQKQMLMHLNKLLESWPEVYSNLLSKFSPEQINRVWQAWILSDEKITGLYKNIPFHIKGEALGILLKSHQHTTDDKNIVPLDFYLKDSPITGKEIIDKFQQNCLDDKQSQYMLPSEKKDDTTLMLSVDLITSQMENIAINAINKNCPMNEGAKCSELSDSQLASTDDTMKHDTADDVGVIVSDNDSEYSAESFLVYCSNVDTSILLIDMQAPGFRFGFDTTVIQTVRGSTDPLSNMYPSIIECNSINYFSVEHFFQVEQAKHFHAYDVIDNILSSSNGYAAKGIMKTYIYSEHFQGALKSDKALSTKFAQWRQKAQFDVMRKILLLKFEQVKDFRRSLQGSCGRYLAHTVTSMDWGVGAEKLTGTNPFAMNMFGKLLMELRNKKFGTPVPTLPPFQYECCTDLSQDDNNTPKKRKVQITVPTLSHKKQRLV